MPHIIKIFQGAHYKHVYLGVASSAATRQHKECLGSIGKEWKEKIEKREREKKKKKDKGGGEKL